MANFIPRLEWNDISITGVSTINSNQLTSVIDTSSVIVNMIINHANFPSNTYVLSKTSNTVTLSANATATSSSTAFALFKRLDFDYPSYKQAEPTIEPTETISESLSGIRQVVINNIIKKIDIEPRFVTQTIMDKYKTEFHLAWAVYGKTFRYYESKDVNSYENYELDSLDLKPVRAIAKSNNFLYNIPIKLRRVYV